MPKWPVQVKLGGERGCGPVGPTPDVPEPSLWTQVAPLPTDTETLARKALVSESPRVDPSPDRAGLAPPGGLPSLQVLTAKARPS